MVTKYGGGDEAHLSKMRKRFVEEGYPELARSAKKEWDEEQALKTIKKLREIYEKQK